VHSRTLAHSLALSHGRRANAGAFPPGFAAPKDGCVQQNHRHEQSPRDREQGPALGPPGEREKTQTRDEKQQIERSADSDRSWRAHRRR